MFFAPSQAQSSVGVYHELQLRRLLVPMNISMMPLLLKMYRISWPFFYYRGHVHVFTASACPMANHLRFFGSVMRAGHECVAIFNVPSKLSV